VKETTSLASVLENNKGISFIILNLKNSAGKIVSHNVYWLSKDGDYKSLNNMQETSVTAGIVNQVKGKNEARWSVQVTNTSGKIAFFIRPRLMNNGEEVLPSFWSGSYFSLAPGERKTVSVSCPLSKYADRDMVIKISGWNVADQELSLK
jgi:hypothetical protein